MNRSDFKKLLTELGQDLSSTIESLKQELSQAKALYTRAKAYIDNSQSLIDKITNEDTGLEKTLTNAKELESQISTLKTNADTHLTSITSSLDSIKEHIGEMESAYTTFTEINDKITNEETGLKAILSESESLKNDIEATKKTSEIIFKEISKLKDTASKYVVDLKNLAETAEKTLEEITKNHQRSEDLRTKINNIFNISSQKAHANYFDERQKTLRWTSAFWLIAFAFMLVLTIFLGDRYIFPLVQEIESVDSTRILTIETFLLRLGLVTPTILAAFYCLNQYSHERRLHEQYAFKAVSMLSIESSVELLIRSLENNNNLEKKDSEIISFAVKTFDSIYKDPNDMVKHSLLFRGGNKILELSAEINQSVGEIKNDVEKLAGKKDS